MAATKQAAAPARHYAPLPESPVRVVTSPVPAPRKAPSQRPASRPAARPARRSRVLPSVLLAGVVVFGLVLLNIYLAQTSFALSEVQSKVAEERSRQRQLRSEVAQAESPATVSQMAVELGLVVPVQLQQLD
ncbi:MAG: hypothetical protein WD602_04725 [Actinomycetota bacterium]